jgi:hypothetical protein
MSLHYALYHMRHQPIKFRAGYRVKPKFSPGGLANQIEELKSN